MHKLNIIDEQGGIIGEETREKIHTEGLLHQEIHVWLYTPNDEILFQHRGPDQETYPNLLDATIGGHVEIGDSVNATAIKEAEEEAGLKIKPEELIPLGQIRKKRTIP